MGALAQRRSVERGEASGTIRIRLGGLTLAMISDDPALVIAVNETLHTFLVDKGDAEVQIRVVRGIPQEEGRAGVAFDAGGHWSFGCSDQTLCFQFFSAASGRIPLRIARFNSSFESGIVYVSQDCLNGSGEVDPLAYPLDELLISNYLAAGRGLVVHALGVLDPLGRGLLFVGHSGAGKTTLARLFARAPGFRILSDDRIILRTDGGTVRIHGTPWHGEARLADPASGPLAGVYFLEHGERNLLRPIGTTLAVARLFACAFPPLYRREAIPWTLEICERVGAVPSQVLRFVPDGGVVDLVAAASAKP